MTENAAGVLARTESPWYRRLWASDGFRRVVRTYLFAFLGTALPGLLGWLNDLTKWAADQGQTPLPDARSLAYLGVAAISAGFIALINGLWVAGEDATGKGFLRQVPARQDPGDRGEAMVAAGIVRTPQAPETPGDLQAIAAADLGNAG